MAKRTKNLKGLEDARFVLTDKMRAYVEERYPDLDVDGTYELFCDKALANDWVYANWEAAFRNYLRNPREWGGVAYRDGLGDPKWRALLLEAKDIGFRKPHLPAETPDQYRSAMKAWEPPKDLLGHNTSNLLKKIPK